MQIKIQILLYDFSWSSNERIKGGPLPKIYLETVKHIYERDFTRVLKKVLHRFSNLYRGQTHEYLESVMYYVMSVRDDFSLKNLEKLMQNIFPEGSDVIMTLAERLFREGKEEGREEELRIILQRLLKKKLGITSLPEDLRTKLKVTKYGDLQKLSDKIFDINSLEDVYEYLS